MSILTTFKNSEKIMIFFNKVHHCGVDIDNSHNNNQLGNTSRYFMCIFNELLKLEYLY